VRQIEQASNVTKSIRTTEKAWTKNYCLILDLPVIMALGKLKPNISWHFAPSFLLPCSDLLICETAEWPLSSEVYQRLGTTSSTKNSTSHFAHTFPNFYLIFKCDIWCRFSIQSLLSRPHFVTEQQVQKSKKKTGSADDWPPKFGVVNRSIQLWELRARKLSAVERTRNICRITNNSAVHYPTALKFGPLVHYGPRD